MCVNLRPPHVPSPLGFVGRWCEDVEVECGFREGWQNGYCTSLENWRGESRLQVRILCPPYIAQHRATKRRDANESPRYFLRGDRTLSYAGCVWWVGAVAERLKAPVC